MSGAGDISRLEKQNFQKAYDLRRDLKYFSFEKGDKILDAGCGSGLVTRTINDAYYDLELEHHACDISEIALKNAEEFFKKENVKVKTFQSSLEGIKTDSDCFDKVISRYVLEHMPSAQLGVDEFFRVLRPGGTAQVIEIDGILFNLYCENKKLNEYLEKLKSKFNFDLFVGRKIAQMMKKAGFENIKWNAEVMAFDSSEELNLEIENYESRFVLAKQVFTEALGSESIYEDFVNLYLNELREPTNTLFYNKFFISGIKPKK